MCENILHKTVFYNFTILHNRNVPADFTNHRHLMCDDDNGDSGFFIDLAKKLQNGLAAGFPELGKAGAESVIAACGLEPSVRGETLGIPEFAAIANEIAARRGSK